jgi:xanthine/uracil/vitamin C permease (AzgA family)
MCKGRVGSLYKLMASNSNSLYAIGAGSAINAGNAAAAAAAAAAQITYQEALAAVFVEGWIFILISLTGEDSKFLQEQCHCATALLGNLCYLQ